VFAAVDDLPACVAARTRTYPGALGQQCRREALYPWPSMPPGFGFASEAAGGVWPIRSP